MPPLPNGKNAPNKAPVHETKAIDLKVDITRLRLQADEGETSLLTYLGTLDDAIDALDAMVEKQTAVKREIAKRLHDKGISKVWVKDGKISATEVKGAEVYRVRGVNGQPGVYAFLPERERKPKAPPANVDLSAL